MANDQAPMETDDGAVRPASRWRFAPIALVAAGLALGYAMGWHHHLSLDHLSDSRGALKEWTAQNPVLAPLTFILVYTISVALSAPAKPVLTVFGSFLFGFLPGAVYALISAVTGASAVFLAVRSAFGGFLRRKAGTRAAKLAAGFQDDAFAYLLALRFAPFMPSSIINISAALFDVRPRIFIAATILGTIPAVCGYAWLGQSLDSILATASMEGRSATPYDFLTPQTTIALAALSFLALTPKIVKQFRGRR